MKIFIIKTNIILSSFKDSILRFHSSSIRISVDVIEFSVISSPFLKIIINKYTIFYNWTTVIDT
jgi:hypothetical protein